MGLALPTRIRSLGHLIRAMNVLAGREEKGCPRQEDTWFKGMEVWAYMAYSGEVG